MGIGEGIRGLLRRNNRGKDGDKRSSMPATHGGKPLITNENGLFGWRTMRVGRNSTAKTRAKIIDCRTVLRDRHSGSRVPRFFPPRSAAVVSKFCRRDSNLTIKIDSIRHFLRHYTLTTLMIGQKITYLHLYCHYISKNSLYYVNFLHHNKSAEP